MRFGIMSMQMNMLVPSASTPQEAMARLAGFDHAALVSLLVGHGFKLIELGGDMALFFPNSFAPESVHKLAQLKDQKKLAYTLHLPLWSVEPSTPLQSVRAGSVQAVIDSIRGAQVLEPEVYVLHATGALAAEFSQMRLPDIAKGFVLRQFQQNARESLKRILAETGIPSRRLAIETIEFPFDLTVELAEELDLSMCLDTGHVLVGFSGKVDFFDVLERLLPRLGEIHLHDGPRPGTDGKPGYGLDHQPLGSGDLDIGRLFDRLHAAHYQAPIIFELSVEQALASLQAIRQMRPLSID
jgi:sugar phosphate isomerase/epimerase